jgi:hypothetical protein
MSRRRPSRPASNIPPYARAAAAHVGRAGAPGPLRPAVSIPGRDWYARLAMDGGPREIANAVRGLVDEYRDRCLWFLRADYYPETPEEILKTLDYIERHGDRRGYLRAAEVRRWLSRRSSGSFAGS